MAAAIASVFVTISKFFVAFAQGILCPVQHPSCARLLHTPTARLLASPVAGKAIGGRTAALGSMYLVTGLLSE